MKKLTFLFLMLVAFVTTSMAQVDTNKMYRLKDNATSKYLTAFNHDEHATGPYGGVGATALAADNEDQIFIFEQSGSNYKMKTKSGYYIYAQEWNVDALPSKSSEFKFTANGTSGYRMQVYNTNKGNSWYYVKNENVSGTHYLFGDAAIGAAATWIFEEVVIAVESRTITVSANNDAWGTVSGGGTAEGPITITATPADGCKFVEWQLNGEQVSTQQNYIDETAGDKEYVAIFAELSPYDLICKPTFAKAGNTSFVSAATILANGETSTIDVSSLAVVGQQGFVEAGETYAGATFDLNLTYTVNWGNVTIFQIEEDQTSVIYGPYNGVWPNGNPISAMAAAGITVNGNTATFGITIPSDAQVGDMIIIRSLVGGEQDACQTGIVEGGYIDFIFTVANPPYTVTVTSSNEVMGTVSPASAKVRGGETITISATPNEGYEFVNWTIDGGDGPNTNPWEVTVTEDLDFVANFQIIPGTQTFNITVSSANETMGSVEASTLEVVDGNTVTLTATANDGYRFVNWTVEGVEVSTSATYEATITAETAFVANFEALPVYPVSVSVNDDTMGTAEISASEVIEGKTVTLTANAKAGYLFANWTVGGVVVSTEATYEATVTAETVFVANFVDKPYFTDFGTSTIDNKGALTSITFNIDGNVQTLQTGKTSSSGAIYVDKLSEVITIEAGTQVNSLTTEGSVGNNWMHGYLFVDWNGDKSFTRELNEWIPTDESELIAYGFWVGQDGDGSHGGVNDETGYNHLGEVLTEGSRATNGVLKEFTIPSDIPAGDYRARYKLDWNCINPDATLDTNQGAMVLDFTLRVTQPVPPTVYAVSVATADEAMGTAEVSATEVEEGEEVTFTATAAEGYQFVNWTSGEEVVSTENPYTVTVTANVEYTANFVEVPVVKYAVSAEANPVEAGSVTISATEVEENGTVDLTATANEGYEFVNWTVEGTEVSTDASFTATVTAETAYVANFVAQEFTITYMVDGEEYASETYAFGATVTPVAVPAEKEGYTFSGWSEIPATMPAENVTITGTFAVNSYDIVYIVDGEEYETETYAYGATVTPIAEPTKAGYTFSGWSEIPTTMPAENVTVTGTFAVNSYDIVYIVDGEEYETETYAYGATVTPVAEPTKDGYTFSGWSEIPATMPAEDVEVTGTFTVNSYEIVYYVDGEEYASETYAFGATVTPVAEPTKDGYTFSGWSTIPATMPAEDVEVTGTFTIVIKENVEVTDDNKEENANATYANVTVANEKVWDIKANTISADKVSVSVSATGAAPQIKIEDGGKVTAALEVNRVVKKGEWAMMALPFAVDLANVTVDGVAAQNNVNIKVMVYDAAKRATESIELWTKSGWVDLQGTTIAANQGFAVAVNAQNGDEQTVTFASAPQTYDGADKEVALDRYASTVNEGADADWNFFGNPTLANAEKGANYALYIYNAEDDSYDEYSSSDVVTCQPYAAMFTQSADDFNTLSFSNGTAGVLNDANGVFGEMQFSLNGEDEARVVLSDEANDEYVRNEDALYFAAPNANLAQLYIVKGNIKMAVSEQPALSESMALGYKAAKAGEQTLTLTSLPDNASVVLKDNVTGDEVALTVGDSYTFESAAGTFNNRFVVKTTDLTGIAQATAEGDVKVVVNGDEINIYGAEAGTEVVAYTTNGMVVASAVATEGVTTLSTSANGVIIVKVANTAVKVVK